MIIDVLTRCDWYFLQDKLDVDKGVKAWLGTLENFLNCRSREKIQIAAICSDENVLSYADLQPMCIASADAAFIDLGCMAEDQKIYATSICILVKNLQAINHEDALGAFLSAISEALSNVGERLTAKSGNDEAIGYAKKGIEEASGEIRKIPRYPESSLTDTQRAKDLSSYLTIGVWDGDQGNLYGFPTVRMLFFLPEAAYDVLKKYAETEKPAAPAEPKYYFFKQIRAIAHDENQVVTELKINLAKKDAALAEKDAALADTMAELADTKAELAKALNENTDLKKKNADLEAALSDARDKNDDDMEK